MAEAGSLGVEEFSRWRSLNRPFTLLDVRRDAELRLASIPGALHVPMHLVPGRMNEIPRDKPIVVVCHIGERSAMIAQMLARSGFENVYNLEGGIDAYSATIDPSIPRY